MSASIDVDTVLTAVTVAVTAVSAVQQVNYILGFVGGTSANCVYSAETVANGR